MLVKTYGSAVYGIRATTITIEVNVSQGIIENIANDKRFFPRASI
jgi:hypothetical protein